MSTKHEKRGQAKKSRAGIGDKMRAELSKTICDRLIKSDIYIKASNVMLYHSIGSEVMTDIIVDDCLMSKNLYLPRVNAEKTEIDCCFISDKSELTLGAFKIPEPSRSCKAISADILDIVVVPLIAFDKGLRRLGYGGGYYDRFLRDIKAIKIGLAFEQQRLEKIIVDENDVMLDMVITDKNIYCR